MKQFLRSTPTFLSLILTGALLAQGERIYIMNAPGYNMADPPLVAAIEGLGHTVDVSGLGATQLPAGFMSACEDPENGYHWLCFYGSQDFTPLIPPVQAFLAAGGKVLLQYEVSCCVIASQSVAEMASAFTGLTITPNAADFLALSVNANIIGWEAVSSVGCLNIGGNAYKCMDGLPSGNALHATANVNGSAPPFTDCSNFGFVFHPEDLPGQSGGLIGLGDVNLYYESAGEPPNSGGTQPVDLSTVELIFGTPTSKCSLLPSGCLSTGVPEQPTDLMGGIFPNPADEQLTVETRVDASMRISVFNAVGQLVYSQSTQGAALTSVPTGALAAGAYHLLLRYEDRQESATFVVEH